MKNTNIGDNIRELRKERSLSLQDFASEMNASLGESQYSRDVIYRMEKGMSKVPAEFILQVSKIFDVSLERLYYGGKAYTIEELENNPPHGVSSENYKHFLAYVKNLASQADGLPINSEMLSKFEQAVQDMDKVLTNNVEIRAKLDFCTHFMKDHLKPKN